MAHTAKKKSLKQLPDEELLKCRLFFGSSRQLNESRLRQVLGQYGAIVSLSFHSPSRTSGYVTFYDPKVATSLFAKSPKIYMEDNIMVELKEYEPKDYMKEGDIHTIRSTRNKFASEHPNLVNAIASSASGKSSSASASLPALNSSSSTSKPVPNAWGTPISSANNSSFTNTSGSLASSILPPLSLSGANQNQSSLTASQTIQSSSSSSSSSHIESLNSSASILNPIALNIPDATLLSNNQAILSKQNANEPISPLAALNATATVLTGSGGLYGPLSSSASLAPSVAIGSSSGAIGSSSGAIGSSSGAIGSSSGSIGSSSGVIGKPRLNPIIGGTPAESISISELSGPEMMLVNSKEKLVLRISNKTPSTKTLVSITKDTKATNSMCTFLTDLSALQPSAVRQSSSKKQGISIPAQSHFDLTIEINTSNSNQFAQLSFTFKFEHAHMPIKFRKGIPIAKENPNAKSVQLQQAYRPDSVKRVIVPVRAAGTSFKSIQRIEPTPALPEAARKYPLSDKLIKEVEDLGYAKDLNPWGGRHGYKEKMHNLLFSEEVEQLKLIRSFDLPHTLMSDYPNVGGDKLLSIAVPSLSEKRPSIVSGDTIYAWIKGTTDVEYEGYIHSVQKDSILVAFAEEFHTNIWKPSIQFTVRFTTNRHIWLVNHIALDAVNLDVVWPSDSVTQREPIENYIEIKESMISDAAVARNPNQMRVINLGLNRHSEPKNVPLLLFGPFGTGKTKTLVELIYQITKHRPNSKVLVCAPSNSAADVFAVRLANNSQFNKKTLLRLYASTRKSMNTPAAIADCCYMENGVYTVPPLDILKSYKVVVSTCNNAFLLYYNGVGQSHFTHIIIDEAAQVMEPDVLIPLTLADPYKTSVIMAGDPKQLGPRFQNKSVSQRLLGHSIMERLAALPDYFVPAKINKPASPNPKNLIHLFENYRSHPAILQFASETFYDGRLLARVDPAQLPSLGDWEVLGNPNFPIMFCASTGTEQCEQDSPSFFNYVEAQIIVLLVQSLLTDPSLRGLQQHEIGIIAPFFKQIQKIRQLLRAANLRDVVVSSIQEMQGKEFKAIFISTVRSSTRFLEQDTKQGLGFINDPNSLNTAVTRARCLLVVVGDPYVVSKDPSWRAVMDTCYENSTYLGRRLTEEDYRIREADEILHKDDPVQVVPVNYDGDMSSFIPGMTNGLDHPPAVPSSQLDSVYPTYSLDGMFQGSQFDQPAPAFLPYSPLPDVMNAPSRAMAANARPYEPSVVPEETLVLCSVDGREFLFKVGEHQPPHTTIVNSPSAMEVHISTLGSLVQLSRRQNIISVVLEPVPWSDKILWSTHTEIQRLDIAIPHFNSHVDYLQSSSLLKIVFHKVPASINPQMIEEPYQATLPGVVGAFGGYFQ